MRCLPYQARKVKYINALGWINPTFGMDEAISFNDQPSFRTSTRICWSTTESPSWKRNHGKPCVTNFLDSDDNLNEIIHMYFNKESKSKFIEVCDINDINKVHPDYQELCRDFLKENAS